MPPTEDDDDDLFSDPLSGLSTSSNIPSVTEKNPAAKGEAKDKGIISPKPKKKDSDDLFGSSPEPHKSESDDDLFSSHSTSKSIPAASKAKPAVPAAQTERSSPLAAGGGGGRAPKKASGLFGSLMDEDDELFSEPKPSDKKPTPQKKDPPTGPGGKKKPPAGAVALFGGADLFGADTNRGESAVKSEDKKDASVAKRKDDLFSK